MTSLLLFSGLLLLVTVLLSSLSDEGIETISHILADQKCLSKIALGRVARVAPFGFAGAKATGSTLPQFGMFVLHVLFCAGASSIGANNYLGSHFSVTVIKVTTAYIHGYLPFEFGNRSIASNGTLDEESNAWSGGFFRYGDTSIARDSSQQHFSVLLGD